jgi:hypothetical protein
MPRARTLFRESILRETPTIDGRHEYQEAAWHGGMRGQPRALRPERLFGHLDDDLLPFFQQLFDLGLGSLLAIAVAAARRT